MGPRNLFLEKPKDPKPKDPKRYLLSAIGICERVGVTASDDIAVYLGKLCSCGRRALALVGREDLRCGVYRAPRLCFFA